MADNSPAQNLAEIEPGVAYGRALGGRVRPYVKAVVFLVPPRHDTLYEMSLLTAARPDCPLLRKPTVSGTPGCFRSQIIGWPAVVVPTDHHRTPEPHEVARLLDVTLDDALAAASRRGPGHAHTHWTPCAWEIELVTDVSDIAGRWEDVCAAHLAASG